MSVCAPSGISAGLPVYGSQLAYARNMVFRSDPSHGPSRLLALSGCPQMSEELPQRELTL